MAAGPEKVVVRSPESEDKLTIVLRLNGSQRNLSRAKDEPLEKPLMRIQKSAAPPIAGGSKAKKHRAKHSPASVPMQLPRTALHDGDSTDSPEVDTSTSNDEAWQHGRLLRVGSETFVVDRNPPTVEKLEVHGKAIVGCPVLAMATLQFADEEACQWKWHRRPAGSSPRSGSSAAANFTALDAHERRYIPTHADAGCTLRVECTPAAETAAGTGDSGLGGAGSGALDSTSNGVTAGGRQLRLGDSEILTIGPVEAGPGDATPIAQRHALTAEPLTHPDFRVITYNILADQYASSVKGVTKLFAYCPSRFLDGSYRRPLILAELLGFNADIICLQEVDEKAFAVYFHPHLRAAGFDGVYTNKAGKTAEGSATFWRCSRFTTVARRDLNFREIFAELADSKDQGSCHAALLPLLQASPHLVDALQRVGTIAQMVVLRPAGPGIAADADSPGAASTAATGTQPAPGRVSNAAPGPGSGGTSSSEHSVCVVNTHLFFHPRAPHIRTLHIAAALAEADRFMAEVAAQDGSTGSSGSSTMRPALLLCGDLNSDLNEGIPGTIELLRSGTLPADFWDWREGAGFAFGRRRSAQPSDTGAAAVANGLSSDEDEEAGDDAAPAPATGAAAAGSSPNGTARSGGFGASPIARDATAFGSGQAASAAAAAAEHAEEQAAVAPTNGSSADTREPTTPRVVGVDLRSPFTLAAADELKTDFTNYVRGYVGALDYVWYEPRRMTVKRQIPLPSREDVLEYLPSAKFPSDHLSVVFDMSWRSDGNAADLSTAATAEPADAASPRRMPLPAQLSNVPIAVQALQRSGVIAIPTDTLYGVAALASSSEGIAAIYTAKRRQLLAPLAICVGDVFDIPRYAETEHLPRGLLRDLLPGPVTVVLRRRADAPLSPDLNPGVATIGVRVPDNGFARDVCRGAGGALALTSANISGATSPLQVTEFEELWPACAAVFDAGRIAISNDTAGGDAIADGIGQLAAASGDRGGSCIVDLSAADGGFRILRRGAEPAAKAVISLLQGHGLRQR